MFYDDSYDPINNITEINGVDGLLYTYMHFARNSIDVNYQLAYKNKTTVQVGSRIGQLARFASGYHHLHYQILKGDVYVNPLAVIAPHLDTKPPEIWGVHFVAWNDGSREFTAQGVDCIALQDRVDIVAEINDSHEELVSLGRSEPVWVYDLWWEVCSVGSNQCTLHTTHQFDEMPTMWGAMRFAANRYYANRHPWNSRSSYRNPPRANFVLLTNFDDPLNNFIGHWDTNDMQNGTYTVTVTAEDFAHHTTTHSERVCIDNS